MTGNGARKLLLTFCNQKSSLLHSMCVLDIDSGDAGWVNLDWIPEDSRRDLGGSAGVCRHGDAIVMCTQSLQSALLAVVDPVAGTPFSTLRLEGVRDPHSVLVRDGYVYVTSTGTNEIYRVDVSDKQLGRQELFWQYPGVSTGEDEIHLNGIAMLPEGLVATCFGPRQENGSWGTNGRVFLVESFQSLFEDLHQPHSPTVIDGKLCFAESGSGTVRVCERRADDGWRITSEIHLGGYTRGLGGLGDRLIVGISEKRRISRSRNTPVGGDVDLSTAELRAIDLATGQVEKLVDLAAFAREVFEIVPVDGPFELVPQLEAVKERIQDMEQTVENVQMKARAWNEKLMASDAQVQDGTRRIQILENELYLHRTTYRQMFGAPVRWIYRLGQRLGLGQEADSRMRKRDQDD